MRPFGKFIGAAPKAVVLAAALGIYFSVPAPSRGDSVSISDPAAFAFPVTLSSGTSDWAYYGLPNDPTPPGGPVSIGFEHPVSTHFSNISAVLGGLNGFDTTSSGYPSFNWTGGSPDSTGSSHVWVYDDHQTNDGLTFTLLVSPGDSVVDVYANIFAPIPIEFDASLSSGASAIPNTAALPGSADADHHYGVYAIDVTNTSAVPETLTVKFIQTSSNGNANIGLYGASVTAVPEPATLSVLMFGSVAILARRRRHRA
jgi:hypothetical protein